jgi:hypothetical protein
MDILGLLIDRGLDPGKTEEQYINRRVIVLFQVNNSITNFSGFRFEEKADNIMVYKIYIFAYVYYAKYPNLLYLSDLLREPVLYISGYKYMRVFLNKSTDDVLQKVFAKSANNLIHR